MEEAKHVTRDGSTWEPKYLDDISIVACIACGRCFKVCSQGVIETRGVTEEGEFCEIDDEEMERMVMAVVDKGKCIGCQACAKVCAKNAQVHVTTSMADAS